MMQIDLKKRSASNSVPLRLGVLPLLLVLTLQILIFCSKSASASPAAAPTDQGVAKFKDAQCEEDVLSAIRIFRQAVAADSKFIPAHAWLGTALMESENWKEYKTEALEEFETVLRLDRTPGGSPWQQTARQWLVRLHGHKPTILLVPTRAGTNREQSITSAIAQAMKRQSTDGYDVSGIATSLPTNAQLYAICNNREIGWAVLIETIDFQEPKWQKIETNNSKIKLPPLLGGKGDISGYSSSVKVRVQLLDPIFSRSIAAWSVIGEISPFAPRETATEAENGAINNCAENIWKSLVGLMKAEDDTYKLDLAIGSTPTNMKSIYVKAGTKDRQKLKTLPYLVLIPARNATETIKPEATAAFASALIKAHQILFTAFMTQDRLGIVPPTELSKIPDWQPAKWDKYEAIDYAKKLGSKCRWVVNPKITKFEAWDRDNWPIKKAMARVEIECTIYSVDSTKAAEKVVVAAEASAGSKVMTSEALEQARLIAAQEALEKAAKILVPAILQKTIGG
jgi:hypothetical protein